MSADWFIDICISLCVIAVLTPPLKPLMVLKFLTLTLMIFAFFQSGASWPHSSTGGALHRHRRVKGLSSARA